MTITASNGAAIIELPRPHSQGQWDVLNHPGNAVVFAGRRWGKTQVGVYRIIRCLTERPGLYWWVGLSWRSASMKRAWRMLKDYTRQVWRAVGMDPSPNIREGDKELRYPGGGEIWLRSAERPDSIAGEGIHGVILDEFSLMRPSVWEEYVEPTLLDYGGWSLFIGVPKGNNWAANLYRQASGRDGWAAFHFTTYDNPFIDKARIDEIRENIPERLFRQEYLAEIVDDAGSVFRRVMDATTAEPQDRAIDGHSYVIGVDWGKYLDFTVLAVVDLNERALVYLDRFNQIDYAVQVGRLKALAERFKPTSIIAEANAMGEPLIEQLRRDGMPVRSFTTTNATKTAIIEGLQLAFERGDIRIIPDEVLISELQAYEMDRLPSGSFRYGAPEGLHDDTVMALALAWSGTHRSKPLIGFI